MKQKYIDIQFSRTQNTKKKYAKYAGIQNGFDKLFFSPYIDAPPFSSLSVQGDTANAAPQLRFAACTSLHNFTAFSLPSHKVQLHNHLYVPSIHCTFYFS